MNRVSAAATPLAALIAVIFYCFGIGTFSLPVLRILALLLLAFDFYFCVLFFSAIFTSTKAHKAQWSFNRGILFLESLPLISSLLSVLILFSGISISKTLTRSDLLGVYISAAVPWVFTIYAFRLFSVVRAAAVFWDQLTQQLVIRITHSALLLCMPLLFLFTAYNNSRTADLSAEEVASALFEQKSIQLFMQKHSVAIIKNGEQFIQSPSVAAFLSNHTFITASLEVCRNYLLLRVNQQRNNYFTVLSYGIAAAAVFVLVLSFCTGWFIASALARPIWTLYINTLEKKLQLPPRSSLPAVNTITQNSIRHDLTKTVRERFLSLYIRNL